MIVRITIVKMMTGMIIIIVESSRFQCCLIRDDTDREDSQDNYHTSILCITNAA